MNARRRDTVLAGALAFAVPVGLVLPFLRKAFHIDDTLHLWTAQHIAESPLDFYGYFIDWGGTDYPAHELIQHPPGFAYVLSVIGSATGWSEPALHALSAAFLGAFGLGVYVLARTCSARPLVAALIAATFPVVWVEATNVTNELPMAACATWAMAAWIAGCERRNIALNAVAALLAGVAVLFGYAALWLIPLMLVHGVMRLRRPAARDALLLLPLAILCLYEFAHYRLYGGLGLGFNAADPFDAFWSRARLGVGPRLPVGLSFLGGSFAGALIFAPFVRRPRAVYWGSWGVVFVCGVIVLTERLGNFPLVLDYRYNWPVVLQAGLFISAGLYIAAIAGADVWRSRDAMSIVLTLWVLGGFVYAVVLNWNVDAPRFLFAAPAVAILTARLIDAKFPRSRHAEHNSRHSERSEESLLGTTSKRSKILRFAQNDYRFAQNGAARVAIPLSLCAALGFCVALGDYYLAAAHRRAAYTFAADDRAAPGRYFYRVDWGFRYYMAEYGVRAWREGDPRPGDGDFIAVRQHIPGGMPKLDPDTARAWYDLRYTTPAAGWVTTMGQAVGAGFYTHIWGPLPYAFGRVAAQDYAVYELGDYRGLPPPGSRAE